MTSQEFSVDWVVVGRKPVAAGQVAVDDSLEQRLLPEQVERRRAIRQQRLVDRAPGGNGPDFRTEGILFVLGGGVGDISRETISPSRLRRRAVLSKTYVMRAACACVVQDWWQ